MTQFEIQSKKFEKDMQKIKKCYKILANTVGGFSKSQSDMILNVCIKNALLNHGAGEREITCLKMNYSG